MKNSKHDPKETGYWFWNPSSRRWVQCGLRKLPAGLKAKYSEEALIHDLQSSFCKGRYHSWKAAR